MNTYRRNLLCGLNQSTANPDVIPLHLELSDEQALRLSRFCCWAGYSLEPEPVAIEDAVALLLLDTEPRFASVRSIDAYKQVSHLLTSAAVVRILLSMAADPLTPMFAGCRSFAEAHRTLFAACSGFHLMCITCQPTTEGPTGIH